MGVPAVKMAAGSLGVMPSLVTLVHAAVLQSSKETAPTPVLLPGKSHGRRSLVGCSPWGREESDTTERLHFHFSLSYNRMKKILKFSSEVEKM